MFLAAANLLVFDVDNRVDTTTVRCEVSNQIETVFDCYLSTLLHLQSTLMHLAFLIAPATAAVAAVAIRDVASPVAITAAVILVRVL